MTKPNRPWELRALENGVQIRVSDQQGQGVALDLPTASALLLELGHALKVSHYALEQEAGAEDVRSALVIEANNIGAQTVGEDAAIFVRFSNFPSIRFLVPEDGLRSLGEALIEIADTPMEARRQSLN